MGWTGHKYKKRQILWGDEPQDAVDDAIRKICRLEPFSPKAALNKKGANVCMKRLMKNKKLRREIDKAFLEDWKRKATSSEVKYHICLGLPYAPASCRVFQKYKTQVNR